MKFMPTIRHAPPHFQKQLVENNALEVLQYSKITAVHEIAIDHAMFETNKIEDFR